MHFVRLRAGRERHLQPPELPWNHVSPEEGGREEGEQQRSNHGAIVGVND